jgi:hypothetical protein
VVFSERLWSKIQRGAEGSCWEWQGYRERARGGSGAGYGRWRYRFKRSLLAHRAVWMDVKGPIPEGMCVCHSCDNPPCCNPAHLFLGTPGDNARDMSVKGRKASVAGAAHPMAKLTDESVREIRRRRSLGEDARTLARDYAVGVSNIHMITRRATWSHIA